MSKQISQHIVQVIMTKPIYKKESWTVPIEMMSANNYITGQDVTYDKMTGKVPLTEEEKKKYPFIINPEDRYKVPDRQKFDITMDALGVPLNPRDYAIYKLILVSNYIAENKIKYDIHPMRYIGYFYDTESEAKRGNEIDDLRYDAETLVRNAGLDMRKKVALLLNYKVPDKEFFINLATVSDDILKRELVKAAREHPELLTSCFPERNPGIEHELFIVELLHYNVVTQKPDGDIYSGARFLGSTIEDVVKTLGKQEMQPDISKWSIQLKELKGSKPMLQRSFLPPTAKDMVNQMSPVEKFEEIATRMKAAYADEDAENAMVYFVDLRKAYHAVVKVAPGYKFEFDKWEKKILLMEKKEELNGKKAELEDLPLDKLQAKIKHHKTLYKKEECAAFWDDKEKLIEYMITR